MLTLLQVGFLLAAPPPACKGPAEIERVIAVKPTVGAYNALGAWFAQRQQFACAITAFESALKLDPANLDTHYNFGIALLEKGDFTRAVSELEVVTRRQPEFTAARTALGMAFYESQQWGPAEAQLRAALQKEPQSPHAVEYLGRVFIAQRRYAAAISLLQKGPPTPAVQTQLARAYSESGNAAQAIEILLALTKAQPDSAEAYFNLASVYAQEKRFREAADAYGDSLRLDPRNDITRVSLVKAFVLLSEYDKALPLIVGYAGRRSDDFDALYLLGAVQRGLGNFSQAEAPLRRAVAMRPDHFDSRYHLGAALMRLNQVEEATTHLRKALELNPVSTEARFQLGNALKQLGDAEQARKEWRTLQQQNQQEIEKNIASLTATRGNNYLESGDARNAAESYRESLKHDPDNAHTHYNLALALSRLGDKAGERAALERAVGLNPKMTQALNQLGMLDLAAGNPERSEARFKAALEADPQFAEAQSNLGVLYGQRGDNRAAETLFRQAIENSPKYTQAYVNLAMVLASQGKLQEAEQQLKQATSIDPNHVKALTALGMVQTRMGRAQEGVETFRKVVALDARSPEAYLNLGIAYGDQLRYDEALAAFTEAARLAPDLPAARYNKGRAHFDLRQYEEAIADLSRVSSPEAMYLAAIAEKQLNRPERAVAMLEKLVSIDKTNSDAFAQLGTNLRRLGRTEKALASWKKAVELNPENNQALYSLIRALPPKEAEPYQQMFTDLQKRRQLTDRAEMLGNMGISSAASRDYAQAFAYFNEALEICGQCRSKADLHKNLGLIYCRSGDLESGNKELRTAQAMKPGDSDVLRALQMIDSIAQKPPRPAQN